MEWLLIDDAGQVWDGPSPRVRRAHAFIGTPSEFALYAVKRLGFVEIKVFQSGTQILFAPGAVAPKAMAELIYITSGGITHSCVISTVSAEERLPDLLIADGSTLLRTLYRFVDSCADSPGAYLERPVDLACNELWSSLPGIRARLQAAKSFDELSTLCPTLVGDRFTLARLSLNRSRLLIAHVGAGYRFLDKDWHSVVRGLAFEETSDYNYGRSVAEAHHRALTIDEATVHEVDAFVEWPRHGRVRTRYQRMLLPFTCAAGVRWVLSTSTPGKGIDLRAKA